MPSAPASPTTRPSTPTFPQIIRYYLGEDAILPNVETYLLTRRQAAQITSSTNLDKLVVKAVGESGGYGMLIGPHSTAAAARRVSPARFSPIRAITSRSPRLRSPARPA